MFKNFGRGAGRSRLFSLVILFSILTFVLLAAPTAAQEVETLAAQMEATLPVVRDEFPFIPAFSAAVIKDGAVIWSGGYGVADVESGVPVTADTPFPAASISKVLTAYAILGLVDEGVLDLDTPVNSYLTRWQVPALGRNNPDEVTIRRILSHTAGLSAEGYAGFTADHEIPTLEQFLDGIAGDPVRVIISPGRRFMYSGGGYTVLQLLIEEVTGMLFADYMQTTVFEPLGMTHSSFEWSPELGAVTQYTVNNEVYPNVVHVDQAAGGVYTTANDLAAFFAALLHDDRAEAIFTPNAGTESDPYGFGVYAHHTETGEPMIWHDGLGRGMHAIFYLFPEHDEGVVVLTNHPAGTAVVQNVMCVYDRWSEVEVPRACE